MQILKGISAPPRKRSGVSTMNEIKITGTKWYVDIEYDGNIARFDEELCLDGFYANATAMTWIKHKGSVIEEDKIRLIHNVKKNINEQKFKVFFVDDNGNEL